MSDASASGDPRAYLIVDEFLRTLVDARALRTGFELGLIDRLVEHRTGLAAALAPVLGTDPQGLRFLLDLLAANNVVEENRGDIRLTRRFQAALAFRDLMETKLDFMGFTMNDFADLFTTLVRGGNGFMDSARLFQLFDYRRALTPTLENYKLTRSWVRIVSTLTRYEAGPCLAAHDFSPYRRMLDVGGNSGAFVARACARNPALHGTVFDLPLVCDIGAESHLTSDELPRMTWRAGDIRVDQLPGGHDLICFKSMLHDWPTLDAAQFVDKAARALVPGGTLLIYERGPIRISGAAPPMSLVPTMLFFRSYRTPDAYMEQMTALGFQDVRCLDIALDSPFFLVTGRKPGA